MVTQNRPPLTVRRYHIVVTLLLCVLSVSLPCMAQTTKGAREDAGAAAPKQTPIGDIYALIIGISNYKNIRHLNYADKDATAFRDFLLSKGGGSVKPENIRIYLNDSAQQATIYNLAMKRWLRELKLKKGDRIYIYMSGHGDANFLGKSYFLTSSCDPVDYEMSGGLDMSDVKGVIKYCTLQGAEVVFIFDACRTNEKATVNGQQIVTEYLLEKIVKGELVMLSAKAGQSALEDPDFGDGHGLFTYYLLDGLAGFADADNDKKVSFEELKRWVSDSVGKISRLILKDKSQNPVFAMSEDDTNSDDKTIAYVDSSYKMQLVRAREMRKTMKGDEQLIARKTQPASKSIGTTVDSTQIKLFNAFSEALRSEKLLGDSSAEFYYNQLKKLYPASGMTEDARYQLASEFINYGQRKINIHLNGKDISYVNSVKRSLAIDNQQQAGGHSAGGDSVKGTKSLETNTQNLVTREVVELEKVMKVRFADAAVMMGKAINLLNDDSDYVRSLQPKWWFLQAKSYLDELNSSITYDEAVAITRHAIEKSPGASYCYNLLGQLYRLSKNKKQQDSVSILYNKAITLSPSWIYPYRNLGYHLIGKLDYANAESNLLKASRIDSTDAETFNELGILYYDQLKYDKAEKAYLRSIDLDSLQKYTCRNLGLMYSKAGKTALAEKYYRQAIAIDSAYTDAYTSLGVLYDNAGKPELAIQNYLKAIELNASDKYASRNLGMSYSSKADYKKAEYYYRNALKSDSGYVDVYNDLGLLYMDQHLYKQAESYFQLALSLDSNYAFAIKNLGYLYKEQKQYPRAERYYLKLLSKDSSKAGTFNDLGILYHSMLQYDKAFAYYSRAAKMSPTDHSIINNLGVVMYDQGKTELAKQYYKQSLAIKPDYTTALRNIAFIYQDKGDDSALYYFKQIVRIDPTSKAVFNDIGLFYSDKNIDDSSIVYFRKALAVDSNYHYSLSNLGAAYYDRGAYDSSMKYLRRAIQTDSTQTLALARMGLLYARLKDSSKAEIFYKKALALKPYDVYTLRRYGWFLETQSRYPDAKNMYMRMVAADSNSISAHENLAWTYIKLYEKDTTLIDSIDYHYRKAAALGTTSKSTYYYLGRINFIQRGNKQPNLQDAIIFFRKSVLLDSTYGSARYYLAESYRRTGEYTNAAIHYTRALQLDTSTSYEAWFYAAYCYYFSDISVIPDKYTIAEKYLKKYLTYEPRSRNAHYWLGAIKGIQKDTTLAKYYYRTSVTIDSTFASGWYWLGNLYKEQHNVDSALLCFKKAAAMDSTYSDAFSGIGYLYLKEVKDPVKSLEWFMKTVEHFPDDPWSYYHLACYYSIRGELDKSLSWLEQSLQKGMKDEMHVKVNDTDLEAIRKTDKFRQLMQQYFPAKKQ